MFCSIAVAGAAQPTRPNVILFLADDQGWGDLACHGNPYLETPHLDAFAREAVRFSRFYVSPVCAPTRASFMTGRYNYRTGVTDVNASYCRMGPAEVTVAEALREAGYATGIFGKWHLGYEESYLPNARGFDESLVFYRSFPEKMYFDPKLMHNGREEQYKGYCMDVFTDAAIAFMKSHRGKPFFVYLPANLIHAPLVAPKESLARYESAGLDETTTQICGMIDSVDRSFDRLRKAVRELGIEDNTLIIYTSDNGPAAGTSTAERFMAGLHGLKGTVYENGIRVPCFMRWPVGFKGPGDVNRLTAHIDVMPTILDVCGVPKPAGVKFDGLSLLPLLRDPSAGWPDRTLFLQWNGVEKPLRGRAFAAVTERWKLVQPVGIDNSGQHFICDKYAELCKLQGRGDRTIDGQPRYELYDLAADSGERTDLAARHPDIVDRLKKQYDAWFDDVCARWLKKQD